MNTVRVDSDSSVTFTGKLDALKRKINIKTGEQPRKRLGDKIDVSDDSRTLATLSREMETSDQVRARIVNKYLEEKNGQYNFSDKTIVKIFRNMFRS